MQTINQVTQAYVVKKLADTDANIKAGGVGTIGVFADNKKNHLYFKYINGGGEMTHTDLIDIKNILYAKATKFEDMAYKLKRQRVTIDTAVSATPVAGQEYILKVFLKQYIGLGEEDTAQKFGYFKARPASTNSDVYKNVAFSLMRNAIADTTPVFNVYLTTPAGTGTGAAPAGEVKVTKDTKLADLNATYDGIIIEECEQYWKLGKFPQAVIGFTAVASVITVDGVEYQWGTVADVTPVNSIPNGHNMADLEYFAVGARGDMYRGMGYPYNLDTQYVADPTKTYDTIDIHFAFVDSNEGVQKSERDLMLIVEAGNHDLTNSIIDAINTAAGTTIEDLA